MNFQDWAFLIAPNVAMLAIIGIIGYGLRNNRRDAHDDHEQS